MKNKVVIFDWVGVIMHKSPIENNDKQAIIKTIKHFNPSLSDNDAWSVYINTLEDENGIYISRQNDEKSKNKWIERLNSVGGFNTTVQEFSDRFITEHSNASYYKELVNYIYSIKDKCKIGLFSDLIFCCLQVLEKQVDLDKFDYVWLSFLTHLRKNDERAFINVENDLKISPKDILFIDDTSINIENAKKRGWNTCQAYGYELDKIKNAINEFLDNDSKD